MSIELKRQTLLDKKTGNKKPPAAKPAPSTRSPNSSSSSTLPQSNKAQRIRQGNQQSIPIKKNKLVSAIKKLFGYSFLLIFIAFVIAPKPSVIVYKKLNLVGQSIYLPGWFGSPGQFLDSTQQVVINKNLNLVYLCYDQNEPKDNCQRYLFIEEKGMIDAIKLYFATIH